MPSLSNKSPLRDKYADLTREDAIRALRRMERERKYGLVWERPPRELDRALNDDFIALDLERALSHGPAPWSNLIIEGDNYDALRVLRMTHSGKVKVIYIDPPYNTGNKDFVYNDRFLDKEHDFRHSLWLDFMFKRLELAKELLAEDGVIFVSIGEDSFAPLSMLMEQVFAGKKVGTFVWRTRQGANDTRGNRFSQDHEYILCYANAGFVFGGVEKDAAQYANPDGDPRGAWQSADIAKPGTRRDRPNAYYPVQNPDTGVWYPCNPNSVWRFASETRLKPGQKTRTDTMEQRIRDRRILWPKGERTVVYQSRQEIDAAITAGEAPAMLRADLPDLDFWVGKRIGYGRPRVKRFWTDMREATKPLSSWIASTVDDHIDIETDRTTLTSGTTQHGTTALQRVMGGRVFDFPKPVSLVQGLIAQATTPGQGHLVLDFFAGSGTTAEAALRQNAEDDGDRTFILVSSTECTTDEPGKNVCRDVTRERVARVMAGYQVRGKKGFADVEGLGGGFAYLRARRVGYEEAAISLDHASVWTALQLLHSPSFSPFDGEQPVQIMATEYGPVMYVPEATKTAITAIRRAIRTRATATIYARTPGVLRDALDADPDAVSIVQVPKELLERFGSRSCR